MTRTKVTVKVRKGNKTTHISPLKCTTKTLAGTVTFNAVPSHARATLARAGVVYAAGFTRRATLKLRARRPLGRGRYVLTLIYQVGTVHVTSRQPVWVA